LDDLVYLDNAATSFPKPEAVYTFMDQFYRRFGVNPGRSGFDLCVEAGDVLEGTRRSLTEFFGGRDPSRLVFSYNSTDALNLAIFGLLEKGDHALSTTLEHNSVLRPLYHLSEDEGVEVDYVPFDERGFVDPDDFKARFRDNTRLVVVNHASNVIGTVQPVKEIGRLCRERGVPFLIDASQTVGKIPIDVQDLNVDVLAFTGHKSLLGPTGIGGLYVEEGIEIRHTRAGGTGVRSAVRRHLDEYPWRLEYGTTNVLGVAGLSAGLRWLQQKGLDEIHRHEMELATKLRDGLRDMEGVAVYCQDDLTDHIAVLVFNVEGVEATNTGTMLDVEHGVACRTGLHCAPLVHEGIGTTAIHGAARFGVGPFNTERDVVRALDGVREIAANREAFAVRQ
jgi:cysteine desulfurase family protein